jgi:hypothetical protein
MCTHRSKEKNGRLLQESIIHPTSKVVGGGDDDDDDNDNNKPSSSL